MIIQSGISGAKGVRGRGSFAPAANARCDGRPGTRQCFTGGWPNLILEREARQCTLGARIGPIPKVFGMDQTKLRAPARAPFKQHPLPLFNAVLCGGILRWIPAGIVCAAILMSGCRSAPQQAADAVGQGVAGTAGVVGQAVTGTAGAVGQTAAGTAGAVEGARVAVIETFGQRQVTTTQKTYVNKLYPIAVIKNAPETAPENKTPIQTDAGT